MTADQLTDDLLQVAKLLAGVSTDGAARRSISTAYYALFSQLVYGAAELLIGGDEKNTGARDLVSRTFDHGFMNKVCERVGSQDAHDDILSDSTRDRLKSIARTFRNLQAHREKADYRLSWTEALVLATDFSTRADEAVRLWREVRDTPDARAFVLLLLGAFRNREQLAGLQSTKTS